MSKEEELRGLLLTHFKDIIRPTSHVCNLVLFIYGKECDSLVSHGMDLCRVGVDLSCNERITSEDEAHAVDQIALCTLHFPTLFTSVIIYSRKLILSAVVQSNLVRSSQA